MTVFFDDLFPLFHNTQIDTHLIGGQNRTANCRCARDLFIWRPSCCACFLSILYTTLLLHHLSLFWLLLMWGGELHSVAKKKCRCVMVVIAVVCIDQSIKRDLKRQFLFSFSSFLYISPWHEFYPLFCLSFTLNSVWCVAIDSGKEEEEFHLQPKVSVRQEPGGSVGGRFRPRT